MNKKSNNSEYLIVEDLKVAFSNASDFACKKLLNNTYIMYLKNFIDQNILDETIVKSLVLNSNNVMKVKEQSVGKLFTVEEFINITKICDNTTKLVSEKEEVIQEILKGNTILIFNEFSYFSFNIKDEGKRAIVEPSNENVIKGSREGFIEDIDTNILLVRKKLVSEKLKFVKIEVGETAKTKFVVSYLDGVADKNIVQEAINRIKNIKTDNINCLATFEENFIEHKNSIFPELIYTERPEKIAASIMEGKIAIFINGYPTVYLVPVSIPMFMQSSEEYGTNYFSATLIRILRYISLGIALFLPAFYTSIVTFHQEMIPTKLATSIIRSKQDVPIPAFVEVLIMLIAFEMLLEAGARMPKNVGQTISIVGGLIIGEAAVNAKFVSPAVVVIVATVGISGFLIPNSDFANSIRLSRIFLVILSTMAGLIGMIFGTIIILYYISGIQNFGENYTAPFSGDNKNIYKDTITRLPIKESNKKARW